MRYGYVHGMAVDRETRRKYEAKVIKEMGQEDHRKYAMRI